MATDSTSAGYLAPAPTPAPVTDTALEDVLQALVVALVGLPGPLVRPRWQMIPPTQPDFNVDWMALGVTGHEPDVFPSTTSSAEGDTLQRTETLSVLVSAYGPNAAFNLGILRDGLYVGQNRAALLALDTNIVECSALSPVPALMNDKWVRRVDMTITLRRNVSRLYPVRLLATAGVTLDNEQFSTTITTP